MNRGIQKSTQELEALYSLLKLDDETGILSYRAWKWKENWARVYQLKTFLETNDLVKPPRDVKDFFYHIPALEDEHLTFGNLAHLFQDYRKELIGYDELTSWPGYSVRSFGTRILPSMLSQETWEQIKRKNTAKLALPS